MENQISENNQSVTPAAAIELLEQASNEIKALRAHNDYMSARLQMFDDVMTLLRTAPANTGGGMSPNIAWSIDLFLKNQTK